MSEVDWAPELLAHLRKLDIREAPHGLYGIRAARSQGGILESLAFILASPKRTGFILKHYGQKAQSHPEYDFVVFAPRGRSVMMKVLDYATTKVRSFGSRFRMDPRFEKEYATPKWDLEKLLTSLLGDSKKPCGAILLVHHAASEKETTEFMGRCADSKFLEQYDIRLVHDSAPDQFQRGFITSLWLWTRDKARRVH